MSESPTVAFFLNTPIYYDEKREFYSTDYINLLDFLLANSERFAELVLVVPVGEGTGEVGLALPSNVRIVEFNHYMGAFDLAKYAHRIVPQLIRIAISDTIGNCDAVGAIAPSTIGSFTIPFCRLRWGIPTFFIMRGLKHQTIDYMFDNITIKKIFLKSIIRAYESVTKTIMRREQTSLLTIGEYTDELTMRGYPPDQIVALRPLISENLLKTEVSIENKIATNILYVGRLSGEKGIPDLLKAVSGLSAENNNTPSLEVVGEGPDERELKTMAETLGISDRVTFCGFLPHGSDLWEVFDRNDVLVVPSHTEGLPRVIGEGMSRGLPIVATEVGGIPELIMDGNNGLLVEPGNVHSLRRAIERVLTDAHLRSRLVNQGLKTAKELSFERQGAKMIDHIATRIQ